MIFLTSSLKIDGINVRGGEFALPVYVQKMSASIKNVKLLAKYLRFDICQAYIPHAKKTIGPLSTSYFGVKSNMEMSGDLILRLENNLINKWEN